MSLRPVVLAFLLAGLACAPQKMVYTDDEVPLAEPLELAEAPAGPALELNDPPDRVVRLDYAAGAVAREPAGLDAWAPATVNQPLSAGDRLWVPVGGRAELHAGATGLRLDQASGLDVVRLESRTLQLGLTQGSLELRIQPGRDIDSVEVDTPAGAVVCARAGTYRVDADAGGAGEVTVRSGLAEVTAAGTTVPVGAGSTLQLAGGEAPTYDLVAAKEPDGFEQWCQGREQREDRSESAAYTGRAMTGYQDLDGQGTWQVHPVYGAAWAPRVPAGWAPYRNGRWVWADPWGWTWVAEEPWGFAPSHYGRWACDGGAWLWLPWADGMRNARPVYAPALVGFAGGAGFRAPGRPAGGAVAWFPLGPHEPYLPVYPASPAYVRGLNAPSLPPGAMAGAGVVHANQTVPGALTVVPRAVFTGARPVAGAALAVDGALAARDWKVGSAPALAPGRESVLGGAPGAHAPEAQVRPLMTRRLPVAQVPFEARQQAVAAGQGRPLGAPALTGLRSQGPAAPGVPVRLATMPVQGRLLAPARPGLTPGHSAGVRLQLAPVVRPESRPESGGQTDRPGMAKEDSRQTESAPPSRYPGAGPAQRYPQVAGQGQRTPEGAGQAQRPAPVLPPRGQPQGAPGRAGGGPARTRGLGGVQGRRPAARPHGGQGGGEPRREMPRP